MHPTLRLFQLQFCCLLHCLLLFIVVQSNETGGVVGSGVGDLVGLAVVGGSVGALEGLDVG